MSNTTQPDTKPTKAQVGSAIAVVSTTLAGVQALLPVNGAAHLAIAIGLVVVAGVGAFVAIFQTTNDAVG